MFHVIKLQSNLLLRFREHGMMKKKQSNRQTRVLREEVKTKMSCEITPELYAATQHPPITLIMRDYYRHYWSVFPVLIWLALCNVSRLTSNDGLSYGHEA